MMNLLIFLLAASGGMALIIVGMMYLAQEGKRGLSLTLSLVIWGMLQILSVMYLSVN